MDYIALLPPKYELATATAEADCSGLLLNPGGGTRYAQASNVPETLASAV